MAYNKTKHLTAAQKYLVQGKMPQAILEYQQILKNEPKDQVTLMTLGDLFVRQGETFQALEYFERLAKIYLNDGFTTKAIAIYKKVAKLAPEESRPLERLAELYVQQGVLSEARPIYLQLAEMNLKTGKKDMAASLFRKLLEAEPENLRVQTRLGELLLSTGQQKEAIETFYSALQKVLDRGDNGEAIRLADRILQLDSSNHPTLALKVRALNAAGKQAEAVKLLESLPDKDAGGETTATLLTCYAECGQATKAAALAEKVLAHDPKKFPVVHKIASVLLDAGDFDSARPLIALIRNSMMDSGELEALGQTISRMAEQSPNHIEPLEWLVDVHGRASDSFRLPDALAQLALAYEAAGQNDKAVATYEKLLQRTPDDESVRRKYLSLSQKIGLKAAPAEIAPPVKLPPVEVEAAQEPPPAASSEPSLDDETQRYVTQALTDVDLFSSYGLTQKAIDLLESVLARAPRDPAVLERLLDLSVGSGNDRRTAELAALLEQIYTERNDRVAGERFAEFRRRFERAAGLLPPKEAPQSAGGAPPQEFSVPVIPAQLDEAPDSAEPPANPAPAAAPSAPAPAESAVHEVDLSDEWAALSQQLESTLEDEKAAVATLQAAPAPTPLHPEQEPTAPAAAESAASAPMKAAPLPATTPAPVEPVSAKPGPAEVAPAAEAAPLTPKPAEEALAFDLEPQHVAPTEAPANGTQPADALIEDLAEDLEALTATLGIPESPARPAVLNSAPPAGPAEAPSTHLAWGNGTPAAAPPAFNGPLGDLFEEFRSEMGESIAEEDPETHYNLGVAYREMGLLEEAISEFQKVANFPENGPAFRYAMQCSTLLGLAFMEKGQPAIAAIWYQRALKTPGLDHETILALKYDLGVAQELAGDAKAAFESFSQVYAMNIDYRDVSERIALLGKAR